ncbi:YopT-type cysteine protease domain-containing protein [Pokkaliibacter sp. MBI-7]|uniref:YopT-type cysteine protease domain-containing protein n=1 Tax=Pokkaliibacter sp. MBI-7 TaxID=3040600 RepID=UPI0024483C80|nr:YopT-type cysteine protease domain-containing protein [Pokkaliibacter sp. MBI-7]MDH2432088.1 YopT-type cysteine protease domain-containing protein [Pokkaliibacter sp. MBI-7]
MDIYRRTNTHAHQHEYQQGEYPQRQARSSANTQPQIPQHRSAIDQEQLHQYTQATLAKHQHIQGAAQELNLNYSMPFDQDNFQKLIYQKFPEVLNAVPSEERDAGICLGLSMVWLKQRLQGKNDNEFHQAILNPEHDAALLQVLAAQHVEQGNVPAELPPNAISETVAPALGLQLIPASRTQISQTIPITPMAHFAESLEQAIQQPRPQQGLLLLTDHHATALFRDSQNALHFFDPNCGVISSPAENRIYLYAMMSNLMENTTPNKSNNVYLTEMQSPSKPIFQERSLHTLRLAK